MTEALSESLLPATRSLLERRPLLNLYFLSMLDRFAAAGIRSRVRSVVCSTPGGEVLAAAECGRNLVFETGEGTGPEIYERLALAAYELEAGRHAIIGPRREVALFQRAYAALGVRELQVREQILYALDRGDLRGRPLPGVRAPQLSELDEVLRVHAAMCLEDLGHDQVAENPHGYRQYFRQLIREGRVWVVARQGRVLFKAESGIETARGAQVEGVYTDPADRRRGLARGGLAQVCRDLLGRVPCVTLYVNEGNEAAIALYLSLGFRKVSDWRTVVVWKD
jgi:ribosomal protein S18 acetylase RimI-like enzyme